MIEKEIEIRTVDGIADGFFYKPKTTGTWSAVLFLTDIGGIRSSQRAMAARLSSEGYAVLLPNIFYRCGRPPMYEPGVKFGDASFMMRREELSSALTPDAVERDGSSYVDFLAQQDGLKKGSFGALGLCFAGAITMRFAAARPDGIALAISFHGGRLVENAPTSPHLLLPRIKARLYFGHASNDNSMPAEAIEKLNRALESWGGKYESEVYEGALHGWTVPDSPMYNPVQAERAFAKLKHLLAETL